MRRLFSPRRHVTGFVPEGVAGFAFRRILVWVKNDQERIVSKLVGFSFRVVFPQVSPFYLCILQLPAEELGIRPLIKSVQVCVSEPLSDDAVSDAEENDGEGEERDRYVAPVLCHMLSTK
jgi:hypothetical protein